MQTINVLVEPSERLTYRLLNPTSDDTNLLFELDQDPEVMRFISNGVPTSMETINEVFVPRLSSFTSIQKGWGMWGVFTATNNKFIGWVLVRPMHFFSDNPQFHDLELGWRFKRSSWGQGYATESAQHVLSALANQTGITTFSAIAVTENHASINIMKKLGMQYVDSGVHKDPLGDMLVDTYRITL